MLELKAPTIATVRVSNAALHNEELHPIPFDFPKKQQSPISRVKLNLRHVIATIAAHSASDGSLRLGPSFRSSSRFLRLAFPRQIVNRARTALGGLIARLGHPVRPSVLDAQSLCFALPTMAGLLEQAASSLQRRGSNFKVRHRHAEHI